MICKNCQQEGHGRAECKNDRKMVWDDVPTKTAEEAWQLLIKASDERDLFDFKEVSIPGYSSLRLGI
jgi:hypothetical protein